MGIREYHDTYSFLFLDGEGEQFIIYVCAMFEMNYINTYDSFFKQQIHHSPNTLYIF